MLVFNVFEFTQNTTKVFDSALIDEVIIHNDDGNSYKLLPIKQTEKSPFEDIPRIKLDITTQEIVEILHECRAGI
ncbi:MAG: hypothetical protein LBH20_07565 [Treponema sp.]|jgi:hypothetical protein|nr:hypothetical protein [Treponema sp.]